MQFVWTVVGFFAWRIAPRIANFIYPDETNNDGPSEWSIDPENLVCLGSFLIGVFYLVGNVPQVLVEFGGLFIEMSRQDTSITYNHASNVFNRAFTRENISGILIIPLALWMMLRPAYSARVFSKIRQKEK